VRPITIGTTEGDDSEVTKGLMPGEVLVMTGVDKLEEGSKVNVQTPSAKPAPAAPPANTPTKTPGSAKTPKGK
jgi:multidrug efflux system membrane fusion protein